MVTWNVSTLRPKQKCHHFADDICRCNFLKKNVWIYLNISLKFVHKVRINNIPGLVQVMAWHRPGLKPLTEPMKVELLTQTMKLFTISRELAGAYQTKLLLVIISETAGILQNPHSLKIFRSTGSAKHLCGTYSIRFSIYLLDIKNNKNEINDTCFWKVIDDKRIYWMVFIFVIWIARFLELPRILFYNSLILIT